MADKAVSLTVSVYQSQVDKIRDFVSRSKQFKTEASFFQHIIDSYFNKDKTSSLKNIMLFVGYPMIFATVMLYITNTVQNVNEVLLKNAIFTDLIIYTNVFMVIGFAFLGILIAGFVFLLTGRRKK